MRIQTTVVMALILIGVVPVAGFTWFTYNHMVERELADVRDRHLLLAENVAAALSRYENDVRATVGAVADALRTRGDASASEPLMSALNIECVVALDAVTLKPVMRAPLARACGDAALQARLGRQAPEQGYRFTGVVARPGRPNAMHLVGRNGPHIVIACVSTEYFVELGAQIAFGEKGHAAIVDHEGRVLSHPKAEWVREAREIAHIAPVARMMAGETGVERFHSPALEADMIAGLTAVRGPGWGVMIPQPVSELHARAVGNLLPLLIGLVVAAGLGALLLFLSFRWLARPLENLARELSRQVEKGMPSAVPPSDAVTRIFELRKIVDAYNALAATVAKGARELTDRALHDPVTGIGNRAYFENGGQAQIDRRIAQGRRGVLFFCDLDGFKEINDTRGHALGDEVLTAFARQIYPGVKRYMDREFRGVPGDHPIVGRIGGDEFAILLPIPTDAGDIDAIGEAVRRELPTRLSVDGMEIGFGISAGGAAYPEHGTQIQELLRRADVALYAAKAAGKNRFLTYRRESALGGKSEILAAVTQAVAGDELLLEYQPKYSVADQRVGCVEALIRWDHPQVGRVSPGVFLPAIEGTATMIALGRWVIERAVADMKMLEAQGERLGVAVNIATEHFSSDGFLEHLIAVCERAAFEPSRLQIEVTEEAMHVAQDVFERNVERVKAHGFSIALDDFGKGFSNIARMASIPADVIKLDRSLISEAGSDARMRSVMKAAIELAHGLGSQVVVEGVETVEEVAMATDAGADALQGFYFSASLPTGDLRAWLAARRGSPQHDGLERLRKELNAA